MPVVVPVPVLVHPQPVMTFWLSEVTVAVAVTMTAAHVLLAQ